MKSGGRKKRTYFQRERGKKSRPQFEMDTRTGSPGDFNAMGLTSKVLSQLGFVLFFFNSIYNTPESTLFATV